MRSSRAALAVLIVLLATAASAAGSSTPSTRLAAIMAAARAQRSVHYVAQYVSGADSVTEVGDVGRSEGVQRITARKGGTTGELEVVVDSRGAFVIGDRFALEQIVGLSRKDAETASGKWLYLPRSDPLYPAIAAAVTLGSFVQELELRRPLRSLPDAVSDGRRLERIEGRSATGAAGTATLLAPGSGAPLPLSETITHGTTRDRITISGWNERLSVPWPRLGEAGPPAGMTA